MELIREDGLGNLISRDEPVNRNILQLVNVEVTNITINRSIKNH